MKLKQADHIGVTFFYPVDPSGDVHVQKQRGAGFSMPRAAIIMFVAGLIERGEISEKELALLVSAK